MLGGCCWEAVVIATTLPNNLTDLSLALLSLRCGRRVTVFLRYHARTLGVCALHGLQICCALQVQVSAAPHCCTAEDGGAALLLPLLLTHSPINMFYAILEQTISADRLGSTNNIDATDESRAEQSLTPTTSSFRTSEATPLHYKCPWDPTRQLCFAKLSSEDDVEQWRLRDLRTQTRQKPGESHRLRLGSPVPRPHDIDKHDIPPLTRSEGRYLVIYEQALSDRTTPMRYQDIPILLGPVEDGEADSHTSGSCIQVLKGLVDSAVYQSERNLLWLSAWPTQDAAVAYVDSIDRVEGDSVGLMKVLRDDRIEATQREMAKW